MIRINDKINLDSSEIFESFNRSTGPGGQRVNKVETKVELRFNAIDSKNLSNAVKSRLKVISGRKWTQDGVIVITAEKHRSQAMNRALAKRKLIELVSKALLTPTFRLRSKPSISVKARRAREKIKRSHVKLLRRRVNTD